MGRLYLSQLSGRFYCCRECQCHLAYTDDIISKGFQSRNGRAYLFDSVVNVTVGILEEKLMITGLHTVADIYCNGCHQLLGWKYVTLCALFCRFSFMHQLVMQNFIIKRRRRHIEKTKCTRKGSLYLSVPKLNMEMGQTPQNTRMKHNMPVPETGDQDLIPKPLSWKQIERDKLQIRTLLQIV